MKTVSKAQLRDGYIVQVTTDLPREQAVRKVMKTWGGQLAAMGVEPALLYSYAHGQERYKVTFATQGQFVLWMEVEPPAEHEPDRTTILDMGIQDLQLHTGIGGIGGENLTPLKRAAQQINKAVKNLKVTNSQAIPPTDPSQTTADPITH